MEKMLKGCRGHKRRSPRDWPARRRRLEHRWGRPVTLRPASSSGTVGAGQQQRSPAPAKPLSLQPRRRTERISPARGSTDAEEAAVRRRERGRHDARRGEEEGPARIALSATLFLTKLKVLKLKLEARAPRHSTRTRRPNSRVFGPEWA
jgi:hypothetical protein